ncbi:MAG: hypothetical protein P8Y09_11160, partial [Deltaproteobacteria bacterium]
MKKSFFFKIFSGYFIVILLITLLIVLFSFRLIRSHYIETLTDDLKDLGITMQPQIVRLITEGKTEELESLVKDVGEKTNLRITVIGADGVVLADSKKDSESMENHSDRYEIVQALETGFGTSIRFSETVREHMLYVALPLRDDGKTLGAVRISIFLKDIDILLGKLQRSILYIIAGIMLLAVAGSLFISQNISRHIRELSKAAKSVAEGDFTKRVFLMSNEELKVLSDRFNYLT